MSNGNGNGEIQKLVNLKHVYKDEVTQLEADLKTKFDQALAAAKKELKDKYLEKLVEWFYSNGFNGQPPVQEPEPEPKPDATAVIDDQTNNTGQTSGNGGAVSLQSGPQPSSGKVAPTLFCDECGNRVAPADRFCSLCAAPLGEMKRNDQVPLRPAGILNSDRRLNDWARTRRRC